jgi:hypothetical protein
MQGGESAKSPKNREIFVIESQSQKGGSGGLGIDREEFGALDRDHILGIIAA